MSNEKARLTIDYGLRRRAGVTGHDGTPGSHRFEIDVSNARLMLRWGSKHMRALVIVHDLIAIHETWHLYVGIGSVSTGLGLEFSCEVVVSLAQDLKPNVRIFRPKPDRKSVM